MAKARGLPEAFKLNVSPTMMGKPVELGDYLDEDRPVAKPAPPEPKPVQAAPVESRPASSVNVEPARKPEVADQRTTEKTNSSSKANSSTPAKLRTTVPRKQINMNAETLGMVAQLMDYVQTYSVQKDLKASELFHALVLTLYEARAHVDLSRVQPRGRWGAPTAAAVPVALKNAFQRAIAKYGEEMGD